MGFALGQALRSPTQEAADSFMNDARKYMNLSIGVKMLAGRTVIQIRGFMTMYNGELANAENIFVKPFEKEETLSSMSLVGLA